MHSAALAQPNNEKENHMKVLQHFKTNRYYSICLVIFAAAALVSVGLLASASKNRNQDKTLTRSEIKKIHDSQLRDGIGQEIKWNHSNEEKLSESVDSIADFVAYRSGLILSDQVRKDLIRLQHDAVKGKKRALLVDELADVLTEASLRRLSKATDQDIQHAANTLNRDGYGINLRANGRGHASYSNFIEQAKAMRDLSRAGDPTLRNTVNSIMVAEIKERVENYGRALPDKFGKADKQGVTPLQAFLITYSIVADDPLTFSRATLSGHLEQAAWALKAKGYSVPKPDKAFGNRGFIFSSPLDLVMDETTTRDLLNRISERSGR
jgi:hypothetical protein